MVPALLVVVLVASSCNNGTTPEAQDTPPAETPARDRGFVWSEGPDMPTARTEVAAALLGQEVVVAGGLTADGSVTAAVEAYHVDDDTWSSWPSLPEPIHHAALVAAGQQLWLIGGYRRDGSASDAVWWIRAGDEQWSRGPGLPVARGALAGDFVDGRIHVVGGATSFGGGAQLTPRHDALDPDEDEWERLPDLPDARDHLAAAGLGQSLYVVGGRKLSLTTNTARLDIYDTDAEEWTRGPDMPTPRGGLAATVWSGRVFVVGGEEPQGTIGAVEFYEPTDGRWGTAPDLPTPRHGLGAAGPRSRWLVVAGGGPEPGLAVSGATELLREG